MSTADEPSTTSITPYRDGPFLLRGEFRIVDHDGNEYERRRRTVALCRCGHSSIKPFCDGTHKVIGFRASGEAGDPEGARAAEGRPG